jgi:hypothetical protein
MCDMWCCRGAALSSGNPSALGAAGLMGGVSSAATASAAAAAAAASGSVGGGGAGSGALSLALFEHSDSFLAVLAEFWLSQNSVASNTSYAEDFMAPTSQLLLSIKRMILHVLADPALQVCHYQRDASRYGSPPLSASPLPSPLSPALHLMFDVM